MENVENEQKLNRFWNNFMNLRTQTNANVREQRILRTNESFALISA